MTWLRKLFELHDKHPTCAENGKPKDPRECWNVRCQSGGICCRASRSVEAHCWCTTCRPLGIDRMEMVVCPQCGCKRCPHAENHASACTGKIVDANTLSGKTHTCSGCGEARARLDAALVARGVTPAEPKNNDRG